VDAVDTDDAGTEGTAGTRGRSLAAGVASGALLIAVLTAMSRLLGLARTVVFAQTVGAGCLGTAYVTANQVPNLIYELAIGGALASAMVPVLARSAHRSLSDPAEKEHVTAVTSALLTWSVLILLPATLAIVAVARPVAGLLIPVNHNSSCDRSAMIGQTTDLLIAFAPQIFFYGISVVLNGLLQAYRKFTAPNLAPVLANVVTISAFLLFAMLDKNQPVTSTPLAAQLVLSIGTTMNIGMLVLVALPPTFRLRLRLRPTLRFPPGVVQRASGLALVGLLEFIASDVQSVVTIGLANGHGDTGALVLNNYTVLVFTSMCSVLPVAIVTSVFPVLSAADGAEFDRTSAGSTRAVMLMSWLASAVIVAVCLPAAHVLAREPDQVTQLAQAFLLAAPGVAGFAVITNTSRVMFAIGKVRAAGVGLTAGPLLQLAASIALVNLAPPRLVVPALSLASTFAMLVVAVPMVVAVRRFRGPAAIEGLGQATLAGLAAFAAAGVAGAGVTLLAPHGGKVFEAAVGALATLLALLVFGVVAYCVDKRDLGTAVSRLRLWRSGRIAR